MKVVREGDAMLWFEASVTFITVSEKEKEIELSFIDTETSIKVSFSLNFISKIQQKL